MKLTSWLLVLVCYDAETNIWVWYPSAKLRHPIGLAGLVNAKTYQVLHPDHSVVLLDQNESLGGTVRTSSNRFLFSGSSTTSHRFVLNGTGRDSFFDYIHLLRFDSFFTAADFAYCSGPRRDCTPA